jgi:hypothetical protein
MAKQLWGIIVIISFYLFFSFPVHAQGTGNLKGLVCDSTNGEVLPFCTVYIPELNRGTTTDMRGIFLFTGIPAGQGLSVVVSYVGYTSKRELFSVARYKMSELKIQLSLLGVNIKAVEVEGETLKDGNAVSLSLEKVSSKQLEALPKNVETDVLRSLQYFPGVQFSGDASARFYVRGGANNQNLVLLNDAPIYNPYHALGIFSAIDPDMINSLEFYKGAYPAEFNGRLSSVLNIITKDGNKNKFSAKASLSFLSAKALVEGPIPNGSFIITGRKSTSNEILKKFLNDKSYPVDFWDMSFKINYSDPKIMKDAKFTFLGYFSTDNIKYHDSSKEDYRWTNKILGFNYFQLSDSPLFYDISLNYSRFLGEVTPNATVTKSSTNILDDITGKIDLRYIYQSRDELDVGFKVQNINTTLLMVNYYGLETDLGKEGTDISVYGKYMFLRSDFFNADFGTRISLTRMANDKSGFLEPRVRITFNLIPALSLRGAWGIYKQDLATLSDENQAVSLYEPWVIVPLYLQPSSSIHYVAGIETKLIKDFTIDIDSYYKTSHNVVFLNDVKIFGKDKDLISGKSESYGVEFITKTSQRNYNLSVSYTLSWAFNNVNGVRYSPRYDSRHNFNIAFDCDLGSDWEFSLAWIYNSGHPFTQTNGYYDKLGSSETYTGGVILQNFLPYLLYGERNIAYLPDYHRLDITLSKRIELAFLKLHFDLSVINVYNRKNVFYFNSQTGEQINMLPIVPTATVKVEL